MIKACLFDLSRILVSPSKNRMVREPLSEMNDPHDRDILRTGIGGMHTDDERSRVENRTRTFFEHDSRQMPDALLPGALDFIKNLHRHKIKLASTSTDIPAGSVLSSVGLYSLFSYVVPSGSTAARPDPAALLLAAQHLHMAPADCVAFEHTIEGVEAAHKAGMRCVAVGDLSKLYQADMGVLNVKGLNLLWLKDGLEVPAYSC
jgi:beta-phosphoglucomutase